VFFSSVDGLLLVNKREQTSNHFKQPWHRTNFITIGVEVEHAKHAISYWTIILIIFFKV
jgi:hypothetical protein